MRDILSFVVVRRKIQKLVKLYNFNLLKQNTIEPSEGKDFERGENTIIFLWILEMFTDVCE